MKTTKEDLMIKMFERYGSLNEVKIEEGSAYFYSSDLKKLTDDRVLSALGALPFLIILDGFIVNIYSFCIDDSMREMEEEDVLRILNSVNSETRYGRFYRDGEKDVNWEFSFEIGEQIEDIAPYLLSCAEGIKKIVRRMRDLHEK